MMSAEGRIDAAFGRATTRIARRLRQRGGLHADRGPAGRRDAGDHLRADLGDPLSGRRHREAGARADRARRARADADRDAPVAAVHQVGIVDGNPAGHAGVEHLHPTLPSGGAVTVAGRSRGSPTRFPSNPYPTKADYKKVVLTITRNSDNGSCSRRRRPTSRPRRRRRPPARPGSRSSARVSDAVTTVAARRREREPHRRPGTSPVRTATTRPMPRAPCSSRRSAPPRAGPRLHARHDAAGGVHRLPGRHLAPASVTSVASTPALNSIGTIRMYKQGISLTVNVQNSAGAAWTTGATVSLDSSRCGVQTASHPDRAELGDVHDVQLRDGEHDSCRCRRTCSARRRSSTSTTSPRGRPPATTGAPVRAGDRSVELSDDADAEREREVQRDRRRPDEGDQRDGEEGRRRTTRTRASS